MKRLSAILLVVLFALGVVVIPSIHYARCADGHAAHESGNCAICQTAQTPFQFSPVILAPVEAVHLIDTLIPAARFIPQFSPRSVTQARAPPA